MAESDKNKNPAAVEASPSIEEPTEDDSFETPMLAVWLVLAAILCAGLYGLYLGKSAKSQPKSDAAPTSSYVVPNVAQPGGSSAERWARPGRLS